MSSRHTSALLLPLLLLTHSPGTSAAPPDQNPCGMKAFYAAAHGGRQISADEMSRLQLPSPTGDDTQLADYYGIAGKPSMTAQPGAYQAGADVIGEAIRYKDTVRAGGNPDTTDNSALQFEANAIKSKIKISSKDSAYPLNALATAVVEAARDHDLCTIGADGTVDLKTGEAFHAAIVEKLKRPEPKLILRRRPPYPQGVNPAPDQQTGQSAAHEAGATTPAAPDPSSP